MSSVTTPWESEEALPPKPIDRGEYGYLRMGAMVGCSREELMRRCSRPEVPEIQLIWHPDSDRLVPVDDAPFLQDCLRVRARASRRETFLIAGANVLFFALLAFTSAGGRYFSMFVFLAVLAGAWPLYQLYLGGSERPRPHRDQPARVDRYSAWIASSSPIATWFLVGSLAFIGIIQLIFGYGESIYAAGLMKAAVREGEWWRLFTGPMLHGMILHLVLNLSALSGLGKLVEILGSRYHLAIVFLVSSLAGSVLSQIFLPNANSVGASGGLMGLLGFLVLLGLRRRSFLPEGFAKSFVSSLVLMAVIGVVGYKIIDNAAHLGGFVAGLAVAAVLIPPSGTLPLEVSAGCRIAGRISTALIAGSLLLTLSKIL